MISMRGVNFGLLVGVATMVALGCGGQEVTSLPSTSAVSSNAQQLCTDIGTYIDNLAPSLGPLACEFAVQSGPDCQNQFNECVSAISAATSNASFASSVDMGLATCPADLAKCTGVTVGQVSQCVSDLANVLTSASNAVTAETACSGSKTSFPSTPPSCTALPATCPAWTVNVSLNGASSSSGTTK